MLPDDARNFPTQIYSCDHLLLCFTSYHISLETGKKRDTRPGRGHTLGCFFDIGCQYRIRDWKHTVSSGGWEEFDPVPATLYPGLGNVWWRRSERLVFRLRLTHIESSTKRKTNTVHFSHPNYRLQGDLSGLKLPLVGKDLLTMLSSPLPQMRWGGRSRTLFCWETW